MLIAALQLELRHANSAAWRILLLRSRHISRGARREGLQLPPWLRTAPPAAQEGEML